MQAQQQQERHAAALLSAAAPCLAPCRAALIFKTGQNHFQIVQNHMVCFCMHCRDPGKKKLGAWDYASTALPCLKWLRGYNIREWLLVGNSCICWCGPTKDGFGSGSYSLCIACKL